METLAVELILDPKISIEEISNILKEYYYIKNKEKIELNTESEIALTGKIPNCLSLREITRAFEILGWKLLTGTKRGGNHDKFVKNGRSLSLGRHKTDDISKVMILELLDQSGTTKQEFIGALELV